MSEPTPVLRSLGDALGRVRRRYMSLALLRAAGMAFLVLSGGALVAGWADLIVPLPAWVRIALLLSIVAVAVVLLIHALVTATRRASARRLARTLDDAGGTGGQIQTGVELGDLRGTWPLGSATDDLALRAVRRSAELAAQLKHRSALPARPALKPYWAIAVLFAVILGLWIVWPDTVSAQARRLLDPSGQHAPPSPYAFEIIPSSDEVVFGDPVELTVRIVGANRDEGFEWIVEQDGRNAWRIPLLSRADGTFSGALAAVQSDLLYHVEGPRGRSEDHTIRVLTIPQIREVGVRIVYPDYTGLAPFEGSMPEGGPSGVQGTRVTFLLASNRPLSGGTLIVRPLAKEGTNTERSIRLEPLASKAEAVSGGFEIVEDAQFSARVVDRDGRTCQDPLEGRCLLVPDRPPIVNLAEPPPRSYAIADTVLPVTVEAEDDFGISVARLYRSLNGSREIPQELSLEGQNRRRTSIETVLPIHEWSLQPGDEVALFAEVSDTRPGEAQSTRTPVHRIQIITKEQYLAMVRQQETIDDLYERYKPWLQRLVDLRKQWQQAQASGDKAKSDQVKKALREMVEGLSEQLKEPPIWEAEVKFSEELKALQETLAGIQRDLDEGSYDDVDRRLGDAEERLREKLDQELEVLTRLYRLMEDESLYTALAQVQQDIANRLKTYAGETTVENPKEQREVQQLLEEQTQIRSAIARLLQDIRDHAGKLPKEERFKELAESANEFATKVQDSGLDALLERVEQALTRRQGKEGHDLAQKAAELMMRFVEQNDGQGFGSRAGEEMKRFGPHLSKTASQMLGGRGLPPPGSSNARGGGNMLGQNRNNRVGLYGNKQRRASRGGGGGDKKDSVPVSGGGTMDEVDGFGVLQGFGDGEASGVPYSALPSSYRSAVRDFHRRVVDELGRKR